MLPEPAIRNELEKILSSRVFASSGHLTRFLRFVVVESLAGRTRDLKESALGVRIFDRGESFDPRLDPVVRVDAGRLRAKLALYYQTDGRFDEVIITLPNGGYVPRFSERPPQEHVLSEVKPEAGTVAVLPFVNLSDDRNFEFFVDGLTEEVIAALAHVPALRVVGRSACFRYRGMAQDIHKVRDELSVQMVVEGSVRKLEERVRICAQLIDTVSGFQRWSETWDRQVSDAFALQQAIADAIAALVAGPASSSVSTGNSVIR